MIEARILERIAALFMLLALAFAAPAQAQGPGSDRIAVELVADGPPVPGESWTLALHFKPSSDEWHGYWSNPGDAGLGMVLDWQLPEGWKAGEPEYPLPHRLVIGDLMNHVYEGRYAILVPVEVPLQAAVANPVPISVRVNYLACTDKICVPQEARLTLDPSRARPDPRFGAWRAEIAPLLGSPAGFEFKGDRLRIGIPLPAESDLAGEPHVFVATGEIGAGQQLVYTGVQTFIRDGDLLVAEIPTHTVDVPQNVTVEFASRPEVIEGILDLGNGTGVRFTARPADVPLEGVKPIRGGAEPVLWQLLLAALVGGMLLNIMPCVFPILSLKALALAKAGGDERQARSDALAYAAGVVLACAGLGLAILALRSAGEQVGWAFQLQNPTVLVALFLLAIGITANFLGLFEVRGFAISGNRPTRSGSFATGLLAAFVATPCTGPFMALALGAALVIRPIHGLMVFVALGVGLALPFLLIGFVPAIRSRLPKPGPWMERFRRWMALPMALTVLALGWLLWRIGGMNFLFVGGLLGVVVLLWLVLAGRLQAQGRAGPAFALLGLGVVVALVFLPQPQAPSRGTESILAPREFSDSALAEARASAQPVFLWFTADWCVTCKVNESVAIEREATRAAFEEAGVIAMRADWTRPDEEISRMLTQQGAAGVPLYLWYAPGKDAEQLPQVLTPDLLVEKARAQQAHGSSR
ncbi:MAG: protein-disulfide reductase DsbD family protein [Erythrobacter sp.]